MYRGRTISLSFPPFTPWVKRIVLACAGIYFLQVVLGVIAPNIAKYIIPYFGLLPAAVTRGYIYQVVTYSLLHGSPMHLIINMLTLWMFGSQEEQDWGSRRFVEFYLFCVIGAALVTLVVAYIGWGMDIYTPTVGASGGIYGLLVAFGMLYGDREIFLFPFPVAIKAKYLVAILIFIVLISAFQPAHGSVANFAHLGGALFGFLYLKMLPKRGLSYAASERYFGLRNSYYRWRRKQAAKKFEVYMRDHDRKVTFDEHGNYIPPDDSDKTNGGSKSGWVN
ncbi:MAG TPA: rhomboid family intramembrane serine protease [Terriglobales bacterium]|nr:rhomboid family intramembrane serine protease [Terriglobales bacterium]